MPETDPQPGTPAPAPSPVPAPNPEPTTNPPSPDPEPGKQPDNEAAKWRRLHEKAEKELNTLKAAEEERKKSELSELDRLKAEAAEAKDRAEKLERENLRRKVAQQHHLTAEATEFLTGDTEDELSERAAKLAGLIRTPASAGTTTNPAGHQQPSIDDRIAAAQKSGDKTGQIQLLREKHGLARKAE